MDRTPADYTSFAGKTTGVSWNNGYMLCWRMGGAPGPCFWVNAYNSAGVAYIPATQILFGRWLLLVGTYDGAFVRLYANGSLAATSGAYSTPIANSADAFMIGGTPPGYVYPLKTGQIKDVMVANVAWSAQQVSDDYFNNAQPVAGRVSRWMLEEAGPPLGGSAADSWGANTGTYAASLIAETTQFPSKSRSAAPWASRGVASGRVAV